MASHSMINESIFDMESVRQMLERDLEVITNECDLEKLVGMPGSFYPENLPLWKQYGEEFNKVADLVSKVKEKLDEQLAKVS